MNDENIQKELKEIGKKLDRIKNINDIIRFLLTVIVIILIIFVLMSFAYYSGHFPPI